MTNRLKAWWDYVLDLIGFYVPAEVDEHLPKSLPEFRARKAALLKQLREAEERGIAS